MIGSLRGTLLDRLSTGEVIVEVQGVGYRASVPASVLAGLGAPGTDVFLHVHTHVREDAIVLYGFAQADERRSFEALQEISFKGNSFLEVLVGPVYFFVF